MYALHIDGDLLQGERGREAACAHCRNFTQRNTSIKQFLVQITIQML
jgi:hypothetical protein